MNHCGAIGSPLAWLRRWKPRTNMRPRPGVVQPRPRPAWVRRAPRALRPRECGENRATSRFPPGPCDFRVAALRLTRNPSGVPPSSRDQPLVQAARAGDREAVAALLQRYQDAVYRFGMRMCRNEADAKDVLQETLLTAAEQIGSYRGDASLSSWLYAIARSRCSKRTARRMRVGSSTKLREWSTLITPSRRSCSPP